MQPYNGGGGSNNRAEAERWLGIAEKLLAGRDLVGTKTFAIRARESDPRFDAADLILAVADALLASEKQINNQPDWYSILQLPTLCADVDLIANQYRRLALLLNPHKNRLPYADQALTMVSYAWSVLSDPSKKFLYDSEINVFARFEPIPNRTNEINLQYVQNPMQQQPQHLQQQVHQQEPPPQFPPQRHQFPPAQPQMQQLPPAQHVQPYFPQNQQLPPQFQPSQLQNQHFMSQVPHPQPQNPQHVESENPASEQQQPNRPVDEKDAYEENEMEGSGDEGSDSTFWTACPYCYYMYEYPGVYKDCTFRCHNCKRAFHGLKIESPPAAIDGKDAYFCCWGFIPLAGFMSHSEMEKKRLAWSPFSQMLPCSPAVKSRKGPVYYKDDNDFPVDVSSSDDSSDADWRNTGKKKKAKSAKEKSQSHREADKGKNVEADHPVSMGPQSVSMAAESSRKGECSNNRNKVRGNVPKEWGRLDLNVELSNNEAEESGSGIRLGRGARRAVHTEEEEEEEDEAEEEEEGIEEGIGFFEGLDDFLSTLPILNVVGEDNKVKAV